MRRQDPENPPDADDTGHDQSRNDNALLIISLSGAGVLLLMALLYFAY